MSTVRIARHAAAIGLVLAASMGLGPDVSTALAAGPSARDIMDKVAATRRLDGSEALVKMTIENGKGQARTREVTMATKLYDNGKTEKRIYRFLSPADVKGTGVLVFDHESKADDIWIFLPALRKTRRIVSSERSKSFMGSEFTYGDLNIPPLDDYTYTLVREEPTGGEPCWVVDVLPKTGATAKSEGYKKKSFWISKKTFTVRKGLYYDLEGHPFKELSTKDVKLLDKKKNRYRALRMEMVNKKTGRRSVFETKKVSFAPDTKDEFFTPRYLERP